MNEFKINDKELKNWLEHIKKYGNKFVKKTIKKYVDNMAFNVKKESKTTLDNTFKFKNNSTRKYANRFVSYQKSKGLNNPVSEVGARGDENGSSFKTRAGGFLALQEKGGKVKQIKSGGHGIRQKNLNPNFRVIGKKKARRIKSVLKAPSAGSARKSFIVALKMARKRGIKYVSHSKFGIYQVYKRKLKKGRVMAKKIYSIDKDFYVKKHKWFEPAVRNTLNKRNDVLIDSIKYLKQKLFKN